MTTLKPCPFCGSNDVDLHENKRMANFYLLHRCPVIGPISGEFSKAEEAANKWNTRHREKTLDDTIAELGLERLGDN